MFIPRSVLRYKLLFYAIAFARLVLGLQLTWPSPSLSLGLALYRSTSLPLSVSLSPSRSSSLVFSLTLLYDYFRRSVAHCRLPLTLNFPAAADPCPLALVPTPYLAPALFALFFHFCFFGRVKVVDSAYGPQKMSVKGEEAHWGFHRREGESPHSHTRKLLALLGQIVSIVAPPPAPASAPAPAPEPVLYCGLQHKSLS